MKNPISAVNVSGEKLARRSLFLAAAAGVGVTAAQTPAQAPAPPPAGTPGTLPAGVKIAVIQAEVALVQTRDGQAAKAELDKKFGPKTDALKKQKDDIDDLQSRLERGSATSSQATKDELTKQIQTKTRNLQRDYQDLQDEQQAEGGKVMAELEEKMKAVIFKYANDNGLSLILNVSEENSPVLWMSGSLDITTAIIEAYDKTYPSAKAPAAAAPKNPAMPSAGKPPAPGLPAPAKPPAAQPKQP